MDTEHLLLLKGGLSPERSCAAKKSMQMSSKDFGPNAASAPFITLRASRTLQYTILAADWLQGQRQRSRADKGASDVSNADLAYGMCSWQNCFLHCRTTPDVSQKGQEDGMTLCTAWASRPTEGCTK